MAKFTCTGCGRTIRVNLTNPKSRRFVWLDARTGKPHSYCYDCDGKLIQDVPLPRSERERLKRS